MKTLSRIYTALIFLFLYSPIAVLVVFSFNNSRNRVKWNGFTLKWYADLFENELILESLKVTLTVAILAAVISTVIGTLAAIGIHGMNRKLRQTFLAVNNIPMVNPEIVTGISMMLMFVFVFRMTGLLRPGFFTLLLAHITFCIPYVVLQVMPKLRQMNRHLYEAAVDLGCPPVSAFFKVVLPEIFPGVLTGALMAFTMSLDDFVISHFVSSPDFQTLPLYVYNQTAHNVKFSMYALCALIVAIILAVLLIVNFAGSPKKKGAAKR